MKAWRNLATATVCCAVIISSFAVAQPQRKPFVSGSASGPTESELAAYAGHEGHPIRKWSVSLNNGRFRATLQSWVDVHPSHEPRVLPLEGMLGFPEPAHGNWYSNGFLNLWIGDELVGTTAPSSVRVLETGRRGRARFVWEREEGTWTVVFVVLPDDDKVFCAVRMFPKDPDTALKIQLTSYPGGQTNDGNRAVTTALRTAEQVQSIEPDGAQEWWYAIYDTVYDYGIRGDGGGAVLLDPSCLGQMRLEVTGYPVILRVTGPPGKCEIRMILWDSFFGRQNAEIVQYMKANAEALLTELRAMCFEDRRLRPVGDDEEQKQIAEYLARLGRPEPQCARAAELAKGIAELRERLAGCPAGIPPDEEDKLMDLLEARHKFLWELRWTELFETACLTERG